MTFVDEQLSRELAKMPLSHIKDDMSEFYPLVASDSRTVQSTAFDILHRALPEAQQQISLDVALEQRGKNNSNLGYSSSHYKTVNVHQTILMLSLINCINIDSVRWLWDYSTVVLKLSIPG